MIRVYIASAYTKPEGQQEENTLKSFEVASQLIKLGFAPYAPLWSHYLHLKFPQDYEVWMKLDFEWLNQCDYVLRLPGESSGADREVEHALLNKKIVFYSMAELLTYFKSELYLQQKQDKFIDEMIESGKCPSRSEAKRLYQNKQNYEDQDDFSR